MLSRNDLNLIILGSRLQNLTLKIYVELCVWSISRFNIGLFNLIYLNKFHYEENLRPENVPRRKQSTENKGSSTWKFQRWENKFNN